MAPVPRWTLPRWTLWTAAGVATAALIVVAIGLRPWIRARVVKEAKERGVELRFEEFSWSPGHVGFERAQLTLVGVPGVSAEAAHVDVSLSGLSPTGVRADGIVVRLRGRAPEVLRALREWRSRKGSAPGRGAANQPERTAAITNLEVEWLGPLGPESSLSITGVTLEHQSAKTELRASHLALADAGITVDLELAFADAERKAGAFGVTRAGATEATVTFVGGAPPTSPSGTADPPAGDARANAKDGGGSSTDTGLAGRMQLHPERPAFVRALVERVRTEVLPSLPPELVIERLSVRLESRAAGGEPEHIGIGPGRFVVATTSEQSKSSFVPGRDAEGTPLELSVTVPRKAGSDVSAEVRGGPVSLANLGVKNGDFGLHEVERATVNGSAMVTLTGDGASLRAHGTTTLDQVVVSSARLADGPVSFPRVSVEGDAELSVNGSSFALRGGSLRVGEARFDGALAVARKEDVVSLDASLRAPLLSCQALVDSTPRGLLGPVGGLRWRGTLSLDAEVSARSDALDAMKVKWDLDSQCVITAAPAELDPERFRLPFSREVEAEDGQRMTYESGPGAPGWTPYSVIPRALETALLVTEDGRFFKHPGFDNRAIESSIRDNARAGRFVRGASTISMQLAKNLYLSRDKVLSRKLQEMALTLLLEQAYEKNELLELYVNSIEFAPSVYGIRAAAAHYFHTAPEALSTAQCFFLASILPSPGARHFGADGKWTAARARHVRQLLEVAKKRDRLTEAELAAALGEELVFGQASSAPPAPEWGASPPVDTGGAGTQAPWSGGSPQVAPPNAAAPNPISPGAPPPGASP